MRYEKQKKAFTLTEVLISAGILAIGFMLIAGAFPVGVKLTSLATERTIGSVATDEAIAKMKIHGLNVPPAAISANQCIDYERIAGFGFIPIPNVPWVNTVQYSQLYPSTNLVDVSEKKYFWSALCRHTGDINDNIQVTIFVSRLGGEGVVYPDPDNLANTIDVPKPLLIPVAVPLLAGFRDRLDISGMAEYTTYFREGSVIVDNRTGVNYTINETKVVPGANYIIPVLSHDLEPLSASGINVWVLPSSIKKAGNPPTLGGRWPCVWVFQDKIKF